MTNIFTILGEEPEEKQKLETKVCVNCNQEKTIDNFWINRTSKDGRCIQCHNKKKKDVKFLREQPETPPMPDRCDCCGRTNPKKLNIPGKRGDNLCLDHTYRDGKPIFRGWICKQCNSGIGYLGDTPYDVFNALMYLLNSSTDYERWLLNLYRIKKLPEEERMVELNSVLDSYPDMTDKERKRIEKILDNMELISRP